MKIAPVNVVFVCVCGYSACEINLNPSLKLDMTVLLEYFKLVV